jgi:hypothetical protein
MNYERVLEVLEGYAKIYESPPGSPEAKKVAEEFRQVAALVRRGLRA